MRLNWAPTLAPAFLGGISNSWSVTFPSGLLAAQLTSVDLNLSTGAGAYYENPEPSTWALTGSGIGLLLSRHQRRSGIRRYLSRLR